MNCALYIRLALPMLLLFTDCNSQTKKGTQTASENRAQNTVKVGGPCETCELINVGIPDNINATDTSAGWQLPGQKLILSGTVYKPDKKTPASDIILYYWQTNHQGEYPRSPDTDPEVRRHGDIRGWVKTDASGHYTIYTNRPGAYPSRNSPAHIHMLVKEPSIDNEYYIDDILFDDDPLLTNKYRKDLDNKAGQGVVKVREVNGIQKANRDIILGLNITDYPKNK